MSATPETIFASLSEDARERFLFLHRVVNTNDVEDKRDLSCYSIGEAKRKEIRDDLQKIGILGLSENNLLLRNALEEAGWNAEKVYAMASGRERACALLLEDRNAFETAIEIFDGNRLVRSLDHEAGYALPDVPDGYDTVMALPADIPRGHPIFVKTEKALKAHLELDRLIKLRRISRPSIFSGKDKAREVQFAFSYGEAPQDIETAVEGEEVIQDISFLARMVAVIDFEAGTIFIGAKSLKRNLRKDLAMAFVEALGGSTEEIAHLRPFKVYPEKLNVRPEFAYRREDLLDTVYVSFLGYRLRNEPKEKTFSAKTVSPSEDLYQGHPVDSHGRKMSIFRAKITFIFSAFDERNASIPITVTLNEMGSISYGRAFPEQRPIIDRILTEVGLLDQSETDETRGDLKNLARFETPSLESEARQSLGNETVEALLAGGILKRSAQSERAWCRLCGESHSVSRGVFDDQAMWMSNCPLGRYEPVPEDMDTVVLSMDALLQHLEDSFNTDQKPHPVSKSVFFLGETTGLRGKRAKTGLALLMDADDAKHKSDFAEYIRGRDIKEGFILSLTSLGGICRPYLGWEVVEFGSAMSTRGGEFKIDVSRLKKASRNTPKGHLTEAELAEVLKLYQRDYRRSEKQHKTTVARAMIEQHPDLCRVSVRTLSTKLSERYRDDFY